MVNESIVKVAIMARKAGMSYGAYVAQNPHGLPRDEAGLHTKVNIPGEQKHCEVCGTLVPPGRRNYCSQECREIGMKLREEARKEEKNRRRQEAREKKRDMMGDAPRKRGRKPKYGN